MRILFVDNDVKFGKDVYDELKRLGHELLLCTSNEEAIKFLQEEFFDMVLAEIILDGYVTSGELVVFTRSEENYINHNIPIVLMNDDMSLEYQSRIKQKTIKIFEALQKSDSATKMSGVIQQIPKNNVIVYDDSFDTTKTVREYVDSEGYRVIVTHSEEYIETFLKYHSALCIITKPEVKGKKMTKILDKFKEEYDEDCIVLMGDDKEELAKESGLQNFRFLDKDLNEEDLVSLLHVIDLKENRKLSDVQTVGGFETEEVSENTLVKGNGSESEESETVKGWNGENDEEFLKGEGGREKLDTNEKGRGGTEKIEEEAIRVKGSGEANVESELGKGSTEHIADEATRVAGTKEEKEKATKVAGSKSEKEEDLKVSGNPENIKDEATKIEGSKEDSADGTKTVISGSEELASMNVNTDDLSEEERAKLLKQMRNVPKTREDIDMRKKLAAHQAMAPFSGQAKNHRNNLGQTALMIAAKFGQMDLVQGLFTAKGDLALKCKAGKTPLHYAAMGGNVDIAKLFIKNGARLTLRDSDGTDPLCEAILKANLDMMEYLIDMGSRLEGRYKEELYLIVATKIKDPGVFEILVNAGCNTDIKDLNGNSLVAMIKKRKRKDLHVILKMASK